MRKGSNTKITLHVEDVNTGTLTLEGDDDLHDPTVVAECTHSKGWTKKDVEWKKGKNVEAWEVTIAGIAAESPFVGDFLKFGSGSGREGGTIKDSPARAWYKYSIRYSYKDAAGKTRTNTVDPKIVIQDSDDTLYDLFEELTERIERLAKRTGSLSTAATRLREVSREISERMS